MTDSAPAITYFPGTVEQVYEDFTQRRSGTLKALTSDVDEFFAKCDPDAENLCLYGNSDGSWTVALPAEMVPPEIPEPAVGINFARDGMKNKNVWLALVAVHTDSWLLAVAYFHAAKLSKAERLRLFQKCNDLPTLYETLTGKADIIHTKNKTAVKKAGKGASNMGKGNDKLTGNKRKKEEEEDEPGVQDAPEPGAKKITPDDTQLLNNLKGRHVQLFWPDDNKWYDAEVMDYNPRNKSAKVRYATGDLEMLNLDEIIVDGHIFVKKER